jgi:hypothetical protein
MVGKIPGVSRASVWNAWKEVRAEMKNATVRDVMDYLDYDIEPRVWMQRLLQQVKSGTYDPSPPSRFVLAKSGGFRTTLTFPAAPDIVLFRALANFIHRKAIRYQQPHVYYRRGDLQPAVEKAAIDAKRDWAHSAESYRFCSSKSFRNWKEYEQYTSSPKESSQLLGDYGYHKLF